MTSPQCDCENVIIVKYKESFICLFLDYMGVWAVSLKLLLMFIKLKNSLYIILNILL